MPSPSTYFKIAALLYALGLTVDLFVGKNRLPALVFLSAALFFNAMAVFLRYQTAWPMMPMYLGPVALPLGLGILSVFVGKHREGKEVRRWLLLFAVMAAAMGIFFPKDFYLPFIKSATPAAHFFFFFSVAGRSCFLMGAAWAVTGLRMGRRFENHSPHHALSRSVSWTVWGFAWWTLSMFAGELWSYLGWGVPVVWDDPAIAITMATWFFYICLLHLHLTRTWTRRGRSGYAAFGALVILVLNLIPELGPFQWPF